MNEYKTAFVGLGSNLNNPREQVKRALDALKALPESRLASVSRLYRTTPWGDKSQPEFVNAVARLDTRLSPEALLDELQALERRAGRVRDERRWGPRILDLDLLLYADVRQDTQRLTLPHPKLHQRAFALVPLLDIAPDIHIPGVGAASARLAQLDTRGVCPLTK